MTTETTTEAPAAAAAIPPVTKPSPEFVKSVEETLGNTEWIRQHTVQLKSMLPQLWTHMRNLNGLQLGYQMKLLGIDWRTNEEFGRVMVFFEKIGLLQRQQMFQVRANPDFDIDKCEI